MLQPSGAIPVGVFDTSLADVFRPAMLVFLATVDLISVQNMWVGNCWSLLLLEFVDRIIWCCMDFLSADLCHNVPPFSTIATLYIWSQCCIEERLPCPMAIDFWGAGCQDLRGYRQISVSSWMVFLDQSMTGIFSNSWPGHCSKHGFCELLKCLHWEFGDRKKWEMFMTHVVLKNIQKWKTHQGFLLIQGNLAAYWKL